MLIDERALRATDVVKVSIDGPPEVHDSARGRGSYAKAITGALRARELGATVAIRTTMAHHNAGAHGHVIELARELGVLAEAPRGAAALSAVSAACERHFTGTEVALASTPAGCVQSTSSSERAVSVRCRASRR